MSLVDDILAQLNSPGADGSVLSVIDGGDKFVVRVDQVTTLAASLFELRLTTDRLAGAAIDQVQTIAENLTARVTYLLEPIQPIESDTEACVVQLRSTQPDKSEAGKTYYEILVRQGGSISLQRYEKPNAGLRREVAMTLTKEVIRRLMDDFSASC